MNKTHIAEMRDEKHNANILAKAIQKAIDGGWKSESIIPWRDGYGIQKLKSTEHLKEFDVEHIIFNHDFAMALWGEEIDDEDYRYTGQEYKQWELHLQEMVISDDSIKYLGEHI